MKQIKREYQNRKKQFSNKHDTAKRKSAIVSWIRLLVFVSGIGLCIWFFRISIVLSISILICFLAAFIILLYCSSKLQFHIALYKQLFSINENELNCLQGDYSLFDEGKEFVDRDHPYTFDLDIYGQGSIFQSMNRCASLSGKKRLASILNNRLRSQDEIRQRQSAIKELKEKLDWRQMFQAYGKLFPEKEEDIHNIYNWLNKETFFIKKVFYKVLLFLSTLCTLLSLGFAIAGFVTVQLGLTCFFFELFILALYLSKINKVHNEVTSILQLLKKFTYLLQLIEEEQYHSELLTYVQQSLLSGNKTAGDLIKDLSKTIDSLDNRLNPVAGVVLNVFLMWDLRHMIKLEKWRLENRENTTKWFEAIALFDALSSIACFAYNNPDFTFPKIQDNNSIVWAKAVGHPLISKKQRVDNDFELYEKGNFVIVTGPNMAGKSTFLRTIGVNLVLAMAGAPVCAGEFSCRIMDVYSSMRTSDSIQKGESYFYAELKRLRLIIDNLKLQVPTFILLDEILKGTNSKDKERGSKAYMKQLVKLEGTGIVATHDITLCEIANELPTKIRNHSFEVEIEGKKIYFDYLLRDGITRKMNATFLMEQMGVITE